MKNTFTGLLSPLATVTSALGSFAILWLATRVGDFHGVAAYATASSAMVVVAIIASGGTGVLFATGDSETRAHISHVRTRLISPLLVAASAITSATVALTLPLPFAASLAGALSIVFANFQEIDTINLQRSGRLLALFLVALGSRAAGVLVVLATSSYAAGMLATAGLTAVAYRALSPRRPVASGATLRQSAKVAYRTGPMTVQVLDHTGMRWPFMLAPAKLPILDSSHLAVSLQVWMAATGVFSSLPYTAMAMRSGGKDPRALERTGIGLAAAGSVGLVLLSPWLTAVLHLPPTASSWFRVLALALFIRTLSRIAQYRLSTRRQYSRAALVVLPLALAWAPLSLSSLGSPAIIPYAILVAEMLGLATGLVALRTKLHQRDLGEASSSDLGVV